MVAPLCFLDNIPASAALPVFVVVLQELHLEDRALSVVLCVEAFWAVDSPTLLAHGWRGSGVEYSRAVGLLAQLQMRVLACSCEPLQLGVLLL